MGGMICVAKVTQYPPSGPTGYLVAFHTDAFKILEERHADTRAVAHHQSQRGGRGGGVEDVGNGSRQGIYSFNGIDQRDADGFCFGTHCDSGVQQGRVQAVGHACGDAVVAGNQVVNRVAHLGVGERVSNCLRAIGLHGHFRSRRHARHDLVDDGHRILAARVVARHDEPVGVRGRGSAHERTLRAVAVAASAEHGPHFPLREGADG